ncbi:glutaredoxin [Saonia flava]|uniref:Glutaredoxin n=1 Tax=Saonia flava TaxID=523696 RepID=A0A846QPI8_9FLAO|nr:glutaredoxin domain-containing protein [Saonia flava]NJB69971.1 glutaredoxin [Saonia flava]
MIKRLLFILFLTLNSLQAQEKPIKIEVKELPNRLAFYGLNETDTDYDVLFKVKGSNFRQSAAPPRLIRIPATSKVHLKTIVLFRGKTPTYSYEITANDSLSRRSLRKEFTIIEVPPKKIQPKKNVTVYSTDGCEPCSALVDSLNTNHYIFRQYNLNENPKIKEQLEKAYGSGILLDSLKAPILNLGGRLYRGIENYGQLLTELNKE